MRRLIGVLLCLTLVGCQEKAKTTADTTPAVQVVQPRLREFQKELKFPGVTSTAKVSRLSFQASGEILELTKEVGDGVIRDEYLGRVDASAQNSQVKVAQASLGTTQAQYQEVLAGARPQELRTAQATVSAAQASVSQAKASQIGAAANLKAAKADRDRYRKVFEAEALSQQQMDQAENQYAQAQAQYRASQQTVKQTQQQLEQSRQQLSLLRAGSRAEQKAAAAANVQAAAAQLQQSQTQLKFTEMRAPFPGTITKKEAEVGDLASPGAPVYELRSVGQHELVIQVPALHIQNISEDMPAEVTFTQFPGVKVDSKVVEVQPVNDPTSRNFRVKLRLERPPFDSDLSGVIGLATFKFGDKQTVLTVPLSALVKTGGSSDFSLMFLDGETVQSVPVEILSILDEEAVLKGDIPKGQAVVISGQDYVKSGQKVRVVEALDAQSLVSPNKERVETDQQL